MAQRRRTLTRKRASETNLQSAKGFKLLARDENAMICYIPEDLIMEILARLPVKSLARFLCVCKNWHSSLTNPEFATNHAIRAQENSNARKVVCFGFESSLYRVNLERFETLIYYDKMNMFNVNPSAYNKRIALPKEKENSWIMLRIILGSCNGLIFLSYGQRKFYLFNPVTGESRYLFHSRGGKRKTKFAFGYDSSTKDYKIIRFRFDEPCSNLWVFSLENNSWRRPKKTNIQDTQNQVLPDLKTYEAVHVGGFLHWQVASPNPDSVLTFDLGQEKFGELINIPKDANEEARIMGVSVLHGCLCVTRKSIGYVQGCSIWAMKEYGVAESWTKLISLKALRPNETYFLDYYQLFPMFYMKEGRVLLLQNVFKIILYDLEKESFTESRIPLDEMPISCVESLVSPNYNKPIRKTRSFRYWNFE